MIRKANRDSKGFTLLEVLIAVLIFSVGLLGLAGMQIQGLKFNHGAYLRSQATLLAYDMLDRIRSNSTSDYTMSLTDAVGPSNCTGTSASCDSAAIVTFDKYEWKTALARVLPQGNGSIASDTSGTTTTPRVIISVQWLDDKDVEVTATNAPNPRILSLTLSSSP